MAEIQSGVELRKHCSDGVVWAILLARILGWRKKTPAAPSEFIALKLKACQGREEAFIALATTGRHGDKPMRSGDLLLRPDLRAHLLISSPVTIIASERIN